MHQLPIIPLVSLAVASILFGLAYSDAVLYSPAALMACLTFTFATVLAYWIYCQPCPNKPRTKQLVSARGPQKRMKPISRTNQASCQNFASGNIPPAVVRRWKSTLAWEDKLLCIDKLKSLNFSMFLMLSWPCPSSFQLKKSAPWLPKELKWILKKFWCSKKLKSG